MVRPVLPAQVMKCIARIGEGYMDNNLLSGLGNLGLGDLEGLQIYNSPEEHERVRTEEHERAPVKYEEADMVFDKSYTCPVCDNAFKSKMVRSGRIKSLGADLDLRPRYEGIDVLKYDIVACPYCGYAATEKSFPYLTATQRKLVKENISAHFKKRGLDSDKKFYTYQEALDQHKLALVNAIVIRAKESERAYLCLKTGWLLRGETETFDQNAPDYSQRKRENDSAENEFLKTACGGFLRAREKEPFPICGMDSLTFDYLLAALALRSQQYEISSKLIAGILSSKTANARMKDKAHDLKEIWFEETGDKRRK